MCQPSEQIQFCTCKVKTTEQLKHYWSWFRYNPEKHVCVIGEVMLPFEFIDKDYKAIHKHFKKKVNQHDAFDVVIECQEGDLFLLVCNNDDDYKRVEYCFEYKKRQWRCVESDVFERMNQYDELLFGKIKKKKKNIEKQ